MIKRIKMLVMVILLCLLATQTLVVQANEAEWKNYISFELLRGDVYEEDYGREAPPYKRHVRIYTDFKNMTENNRITGVEFKAKIYDQFGDLAHETEEIRRNIDISPGEVTDPLSEFHYYEADDFEQTPYDDLEPILREGIPDSEIAVTRIAFADRDNKEFDVLEWEEPSIEEEVEWAEAIYSFNDITGDYESEDISITSDKWRVAFSSFEQDEGDILEIYIFEAENEEYIASKKFELEAFADVGETVINKSGNFYIETKTEGDFEYSLSINEAKQ